MTVKLFIHEQFICQAQVRVVVDEDDQVYEQLVVGEDVDIDLSKADPASIACQIVHPLDAFSYFGSVQPESIGKDE